MNPRVAKAGRSFKGLTTYLSRDVGAATSDRLGFVAFVNLPITETGDALRDSERGANVMAFTAMNWEILQRTHHTATERSGKPYRKPSRPPDKPVYHFSLRFHPSDLERVTPALLRQAAQGALETLGLSQHQAMIVEHTDFEPTAEFLKHPSHVHVVVNKIHPVTGRSAQLPNDFLKLSAYAEAFARDHGLTKVEQRIVNNARRDRGEIVYYKGLSRAEYEFRKKHIAAYKGQDPARVQRLRAEKHERDNAELARRQTGDRAAFEKQIETDYGATRRSFQERLDNEQRTVTLDHMGVVFRVVTRLKQRVTGELKRARKRIAALERSLLELDQTITKARSAHERRLKDERGKLKAVHAAELERDALYFEYMRDKGRRDTAGEAAFKGFNFRASGKITRPPKGSQKAALLAAAKRARAGKTAKPNATPVEVVSPQPEPPRVDAPGSLSETLNSLWPQAAEDAAQRKRPKRYRGKRKLNPPDDNGPNRRR